MHISKMYWGGIIEVSITPSLNAIAERHSVCVNGRLANAIHPKRDFILPNDLVSSLAIVCDKIRS